MNTQNEAFPNFAYLPPGHDSGPAISPTQPPGRDRSARRWGLLVGTSARLIASQEDR